MNPFDSSIGVNPMQNFQAPMDPLVQQQYQQLLMLLGGLAPQVPQQPQPQQTQMPPLLGGPVG